MRFKRYFARKPTACKTIMRPSYDWLLLRCLWPGSKENETPVPPVLQAFCAQNSLVAGATLTHTALARWTGRAAPALRVAAHNLRSDGKGWIVPVTRDRAPWPLLLALWPDKRGPRGPVTFERPPLCDGWAWRDGVTLRLPTFWDWWLPCGDVAAPVVLIDHVVDKRRLALPAYQRCVVFASLYWLTYCAHLEPRPAIHVYFSHKERYVSRVLDTLSTWDDWRQQIGQLKGGSHALDH